MAQQTVGKADFVGLVAKENGLPEAQAKRIVGSVFEIISAQLKKGNKVTLTGFGTFSVAKRKARNGVNPATGEKIKIAARKAPVFKAGVGLTTLVK